MTVKPFVVLVEIPCKPGRSEEFLSLLYDVFDAMKSESTFISATALISVDDPDRIVLYETWADREDFESVQKQRPYRSEYEARLPELLRSPRTLTFFEPGRSVVATT